MTNLSERGGMGDFKKWGRGGGNPIDIEIGGHGLWKRITKHVYFIIFKKKSCIFLIHLLFLKNFAGQIGILFH